MTAAEFWKLTRNPAALNAFIAKRDAWLAEHSRVGEVIPQWTRGGITETYDPIECRVIYVAGDVEHD